MGKELIRTISWQNEEPASIKLRSLIEGEVGADIQNLTQYPQSDSITTWRITQLARQLNKTIERIMLATPVEFEAGSETYGTIYVRDVTTLLGDTGKMVDWGDDQHMNVGDGKIHVETITGVVREAIGKWAESIKILRPLRRSILEHGAIEVFATEEGEKGAEEAAPQTGATEIENHAEISPAERVAAHNLARYSQA